jgi:hypothetical protein
VAAVAVVVVVRPVPEAVVQEVQVALVAACVAVGAGRAVAWVAAGWVAAWG